MAHIGDSPSSLARKACSSRPLMRLVLSVSIRKKADSTVRLCVMSQKPHVALNIHFIPARVNKKKICKKFLHIYVHRI